MPEASQGSAFHTADPWATPMFCHAGLDTHACNVQSTTPSTHQSHILLMLSSCCRMVLTPNGKSLVCVMSKGIRRLELDTRGKVPKVAEVTGGSASARYIAGCAYFAGHARGRVISMGKVILHFAWSTACLVHFHLWA